MTTFIIAALAAATLVLLTLVGFAGKKNGQLEAKLYTCKASTLSSIEENTYLRSQLEKATRTAQLDEETMSQLIQLHTRQEGILRDELSKERRSHLATEVRMDRVLTDFEATARELEQLKSDHVFLWERATALFIGEIPVVDDDEEIENPMVQYAHDYSDQLAELADSRQVLDVHPDW